MTGLAAWVKISFFPIKERLASFSLWNIPSASHLVFLLGCSAHALISVFYMRVSTWNLNNAATESHEVTVKIWTAKNWRFLFFFFFAHLDEEWLILASALRRTAEKRILQVAQR